MGGYGSGRWRSHLRKATTDDMINLDVLFLHRRGGLALGAMSRWTWSRNGKPFAAINTTAQSRDEIEFRYGTASKGKTEQHAYPVRIEWTPCHFGGSRPWFHCPRCGRMVRILYAGTIFLCRHCHRLAYECQREDLRNRLQRRARKARGRLNWNGGGPGDDWQKPKGMHWATFDRLSREVDRCDEAVDYAWILQAHAIIGGDLNDLLGFPRGTVEKYGIDAQAPRRRRD